MGGGQSRDIFRGGSVKKTTLYIGYLDISNNFTTRGGLQVQVTMSVASVHFSLQTGFILFFMRGVDKKRKYCEYRSINIEFGSTFSIGIQLIMLKVVPS